MQICTPSEVSSPVHHDLIGEATGLVQHEKDGVAHVTTRFGARKRSLSLMNTKMYVTSALIVLVALSLAFHGTLSSSAEEQSSSKALINDSSWRDRLHSNKGKTHHKKKKDHCEKKSYSKTTAKTAFELPFAALFQDTKHEKKFEASSLIVVNGTYYAICDNSWAISKFSPSLTPFSDDNIMIGDPNREKGNSDYEAILYHNDTFYVIRESVKHKNKETDSSAYHAIIEELVLDDVGDDYEIKDQCKCEFEFEGTSKGFEGAFGMPGTDGEFYIVGLCEGNHCSESNKDDKGHGQMVLMKKKDCLWETQRVIDIPENAFFTDYSDISVTNNGKVAISSQEDSALWIGLMVGIENGVLDPDVLGFDHDMFNIYHFPKSDTCKTIYCNIEGIAFINDNMIMAVSDQMKNKGKQAHYCLEKDQSIHAFVLP